MYYNISNKHNILSLSYTEFKPHLNEIEKWTSGSEDTYYYFINTYKHHTITLSVLYVMTIFSIQYLLRNKSAFNLRLPLTIWSGFLAIFSICGAARTIPEIVHVITQDSFHNSVCHPGYSHGATSLWALLFIVSKPMELGDTIFIVLRKQKLIFLHWYHHVTVMIYAWYCGSFFFAPGRWFIVMNYTVHAFMYTYYTMRALRVKMPSWINVFITSMQIAQMMVGIFINSVAYFKMDAAIYCHVTPNLIYSGLAMYASYFVLFSNFFVQTYFKKDNKKIAEQSTKNIEAKISLKFGDVLRRVADIERNGFIPKEKEN